MIAPRVGDHWSERDLALLAVGIGCSTLALVGPLLTFFGRSQAFLREIRALKPLQKRAIA